jgi:cell division protein ZapD
MEASQSSPARKSERAEDRPVYEQPLSERMRTFMRLEFLFQQIGHHAGQSTEWDTRAALNTLLDIIEIITRIDVRSDLLKELDRNAGTLSRLRSRDDIDTRRLGNVLESLEEVSARLSAGGSPVSGSLKHSEFLLMLRNRATIPGGSCGFDLPGYQQWLQRPFADRARDIKGWLSHLDPMQRAIRLILMLVRESAMPGRHVAEDGLFQQSLGTGAGAQLLRVWVAPSLGVFPEISGGRHRLTIRFMERPETDERPRQTMRDIPFELACCQL